MLYFLDPEFNRRVKINAPALSDQIVKYEEPRRIHSLLENWEGSGDPDEPSLWELEELAAIGAIDIDAIKISRGTGLA